MSVDSSNDIGSLPRDQFTRDISCEKIIANVRLWENSICWIFAPSSTSSLFDELIWPPEEFNCLDASCHKRICLGIKAKWHDIFFDPLTFSKQNKFLLIRTQLEDGNIVVIAHIRSTNEFATFAPSYMLDTLSKEISCFINALHCFRWPQAKSRSRSDLTCNCEGTLRVNIKTMDIISMGFKKLLSVSCLI